MSGSFRAEPTLRSSTFVSSRSISVVVSFICVGLDSRTDLGSQLCVCEDIKAIGYSKRWNGLGSRLDSTSFFSTEGSCIPAYWCLPISLCLWDFKAETRFSVRSDFLGMRN